MTLIRLKVKGGLGNQLSQISFAYKILKQYDEASLIIDKSIYKKIIKRNFKFGKLISKTHTFKFFLDELPVSKIYSLKNKFSIFEKIVFSIHDLILFILKSIELILRIFGIRVRQKKIFLFLGKFGLLTDDNRSYLNFGKSLIPLITISGYFQDLSYHQQNRDILREFFLKKPESTNAAFSDKLNNNFQNISFILRLNDDKVFNYSVDNFLSKAYSIISDLNDEKNNIFFSDNYNKLSKIKKKFNSPIYCIEKDPLVQLNLAANSKIFVISASSFAWWAYFLSSNEKKIVIKPCRWLEFDSPLWSPGFFIRDEIYNIETN